MIITHEIMNMEMFYEEGKEFLRELKALDFDVILNEAKDSDFYVGKALDKPTMS